MVFYDGLKNLNEEVFDHELGTASATRTTAWAGVLDHVGQFFTGSEGKEPRRGWTDAIEADADERISDYANTNIKEDFAECWAAYMEATDNGPEALAKLEEAYPARYAIMEELYNVE